MSQVSQLVFDVDPLTTTEKEIGKSTNSMTSPLVKLNYRSDMIDFKHQRTITITNVANDELLSSSKYAMYGTLMYLTSSTLTLSFGGLIGQFTLDDVQHSQLSDFCAAKWYCYIT